MTCRCWRPGRAAPGLLILLVLGGCSLQEIALRRAADAVSGESGAFASESDIELAGASIPAALKATEALLARQPSHRGLLTSATSGFTQYAYAFVQLPADEREERDLQGAYVQRERARKLYLRARDYGLRGLRLDGGAAADALRRSPDAALQSMGRDDARLLYWTAAAWASAVALGKDDPAMLASLPVVEALAKRAAVLAPDLDHGALHTFLISFETARPGATEASLATAREHFRRAVALSGGQQAAPFVAMAEAVAQRHGERQEFDALLRQARALDPDTRSEWRLANHVAQRRARWLATQTDILFPE